MNVARSAPKGAVFLSYAREDAVAARRIADALRSQGLEVWFDESELRGSDAWDQKIRQQIRECALFVPIISANAQARPEGYFRLEWRLAEQRSLLIAHGRPFVVPVVIDQTSEQGALVPETFLAAQWTRVKSDDALPALTHQVARLLQVQSRSRAPTLLPQPDASRRDDQPPVIPDFELVRIIGRGGYGDVWLACGLTGVYRAIKIVWRNRFTDAAPFEREFKGLKKFTAISLPETSQLALLHVGQNEGAGFFYYVMELADDLTTGREVNPAKYAPLTLREVRTQRGRVPAAECVKIGVELARALAGLHARGLVHRDIKPSNVILVGGVAKLADIGLVAATNDAPTYVGTEGFVPPEGPGKPGADVFALGRLLYELVTGLDREEFPRLPPELDQLPDRSLLFQLNEIILRASEPVATKRYPEAAAMLADLLRVEAGGAVRHRRRRRLTQIVMAVCAVATAGLAFRFWKSSSPPAPSVAAANDKSIAVLPFTNLSDEKENAYFADGMHEDILTNLTLVRDLHVVSRTSVMEYRDTTKKIRDIARDLGVAYILEGSVRRDGKKVRVTGQLIRAATDEHVWAKSYDRDLTDIFAIQSELSQAIAAALSAVLSPQEKQLLDRRQTDNLAAYDAYVKARELRQRQAIGDGDVRGFEEATRLDPKFAQAWAGLASAIAQSYLNDYKHSAASLARAKEAIETAVRLAPDDPEVIESLGDYYYYGYRDYDRAIAQYQRLAVLRPNDAAVFGSLGFIHRRQGRWNEALTELRRAVELEPRNLRFGHTLVDLALGLHRYEEATAVQSRIVGNFPESPYDAVQIALIPFLASGSTHQGTALVARLKTLEQANPQATFSHLQWLNITGQWDEALRLQPQQKYFDAVGQSRWIQDVSTAFVLWAHGDQAAARALAAHAVSEGKTSLQQKPAATDWSFLAFAYALLGDKAEALRCAQTAKDLIPESKDAVSGPPMSLNYARVLAWVGEKDQALAELARLLRTPFGENIHLAKYSVYWLPLHGDPRFEALINHPANNAPLP